MRRRWSRTTVVMVVVFLILAPGAYTPSHAAPNSDIIYVAGTGSDSPGCGQIDAPCRTIQQAVNVAANYDEIRVAQGIYTYASTVDPCTGTIGTTGVVCLVNRQLTIRGGYASGWTHQDPDTYPSIIDGQQRYRGVMVLSTGPTTRLEMEGFVVQNGHATPISLRPGDDGFFAFGGGLFADMGSVALPGNEVILERMVFQNNVVVAGNTSGPYGGSGAGGGVALRSAYLGSLVNVRFEGNEARSGCGSQAGGYAIGGGLHVQRSTVHAYGVEFLRNSALVTACNVTGQYAGEFADGLGGGVAIQAGQMTFQNATVEENLAQGGDATRYAGGAFGGGIFGEDSHLTIYDSIVRENVARGGDGQDGGLAGGGGIDTHNTTSNIHRVHVVGNLAQGGSSTGGGNSGSPGGGGLYLVRLAGESTTTISNSFVGANEVRFGAAGSTLVGGGGGGVWLQGIQATLTHLTIAGNNLGGQPMQGDAILVLSVGTTPRLARVESTIIANHLSENGIGAVHTQLGNTLQLNRTLWACNYLNSNAGREGSGIISNLDPLSACPVGFVAPGAPHFDYHIRPTSPAVDQAWSSEPIDIDSHERPGGQAPDIGADEVLPDTLTLEVDHPGTGMLRAVWEAGGSLAQYLDHYEVLVDCPPGASGPAEGRCGEAIPVARQTDLVLTDLTDGMSYSITVFAYDSSGEPLKTSNTVVAQPTHVLKFFLPIVSR